MIRRSLVFLFCLLATLSLLAQQPKQTKTILYLIPFQTEDYSGISLGNIQSNLDINAVNSFLLMGFWNGSELALEEYADRNQPIHVIVRDVSENTNKLTDIMEDTKLMSEVDLIIGPFFSKPFKIASEYAKRYAIPIVNPFTNLTSILDNNPYVYKLVPSLESRPAMLSYLTDVYSKSKIILYEDSSIKNSEQQVYINYFKKNHTPFKIVKTQNELLNEIAPQGKNIVITFCHNAAKMLVLSRDLLYKTKTADIMLVVPETWLQAMAYDVEYYSKLNIHFFSNYFVEEKDPDTQVFTQKYLKKYKSLPTLENFAYQGYDITRYFVEMLLNDGDMDKVKVNPISFPLSFDKTPNGGYENINMQFLEVEDNEIHRVEF